MARSRFPRWRSAPTARSTLLGESDARAGVRLRRADAHAGLLAFLDAASRARARRRCASRSQVTGPADARRRVARRRHARAARVPACRRGRSRVVGRDRGARRTRACRDTGLVLFFDEPALVAWRRGDAPLDRESAIDVLSGALAAVDCVTGVHVCGDGDLGLALEAGPAGARRRGERRRWCSDTVALSALPRRRRLDRVGRGAHRPPGRRIGRSALASTRRRCGASSRAAGAIRCRSAHAG